MPYIPTNLSSFCILQAIKNWTVGRPGNKTKLWVCKNCLKNSEFCGLQRVTLKQLSKFIHPSGGNFKLPSLCNITTVNNSPVHVILLYMAWIHCYTIYWYRQNYTYFVYVKNTPKLAMADAHSLPADVPDTGSTLFSCPSTMTSEPNNSWGSCERGTPKIISLSFPANYRQCGP